jgi:ribosomal-protein-alanine N-acetyltransferase
MRGSMKPDIRTARLELRLLAEDDASDVFAYASDPEVAMNTSWFAHSRPEESEEYVRFVVGAHSEADGSLRHVWAIRLAGEAAVIGTIDFVQDSESRGHIDFALARPFWGQGIVTEAVRGVLGWVFRRLPCLDEVRSGGLSRNVGTMRVLEKLGFTERARTTVPRPPKFPDEALEARHFSLRREPSRIG